MSIFWTYFWPAAALGLVLGAIGGTLWLRLRKPLLLVIAAALALGGTVLWHVPLGAADRFAAAVESKSRAVLVDWELGQIQARLDRSPLTRRLHLSGPADDFQREQLVKIMSQVPGVSKATWSSSPGVPLLAQGVLATVAGFLLGLLLAYGIELRRRYNAQWRW